MVERSVSRHIFTAERQMEGSDRGKDAVHRSGRDSVERLRVDIKSEGVERHADGGCI